MDQPSSLSTFQVTVEDLQQLHQLAVDDVDWQGTDNVNAVGMSKDRDDIQCEACGLPGHRNTDCMRLINTSLMHNYIQRHPAVVKDILRTNKKVVRMPLRKQRNNSTPRRNKTSTPKIRQLHDLATSSRDLAYSQLPDMNATSPDHIDTDDEEDIQSQN